MAVFNAIQIAQGTPIGGVGLGGAQVKEAYFQVDVPVGATTTDTINFGFLPPNCMVRDAFLKAPALGGTTTLNVGDPGVGTAIVADVDRYFAAQQTNTAAATRMSVATGFFFKNTTKQRLPITGAFAAGTTTTAGQIELTIAYSTEEPQQ